MAQGSLPGTALDHLFKGPQSGAHYFGEINIAHLEASFVKSLGSWENLQINEKAKLSL